MAEEELTGEQGGKKKSKLLIIIIAAVVLLAGGGGAAYYFLFMGNDEVAEQSEQSNDQAQSDIVTPAEGQAIYVAMPDAFLFNSPGIARERIVQIEVQLMVRGLENEEIARKHITLLKGTLLQVFSASSADELVTDVGKVDLRNRATKQVRQAMMEVEKQPIVEEVLFTGFVIQ